MNQIHNPKLRGLAYRMLGSVSDVEDVLQEAALKLHVSGITPDSEEAYLRKVVSNLCIDRLRRQQRERAVYPGPWLPEPIADEQLDPAELVEALDIGFMALLETLSPAERVAFVLREAFEYSYGEIASMLEIRAASARQRVSRARSKLQDAQIPHRAPADEQKALLTALVESVTNRDTKALIALMSEDVIALTDGGGVVSAAIAPVHGPQRIAQIMMFLAGKGAQDEPFDFQLTRLNGGWGLLIVQTGQIHSAAVISIADGLVQRVYVIRNPNKLIHLQKLVSRAMD